MTSRPCIVNVAFNMADTATYPKWQARLLESIDRHAPTVQVFSWTNGIPTGSPSHTNTPYAFKLYAIDKARKDGHDVVLWLDSSIYAIRSLQPIFDAIERDGIYFIEDSAATLEHYCNDKVLTHYGLTRETAKGVRLIAGSIMGFDFRSALARDVFEQLWSGMQAGFYAGTVSAGSGIADHRGDEAILGCLFEKEKLVRHCLGEHFIADQEPTESTILRSGYYDREVVAEHTVMKPVNGPVLDVGARGMAFAKAMARRGCPVYCMEPDRTLMGIEGVKYYRSALVASGAPKQMAYIETEDGNARRLARYGTCGTGTVYDVATMSLSEVSQLAGVERWGLIKLDCEGAEFDILRDWPGPIAEQISVEFHDHTGANPYPDDPERVYKEIIAHLGTWYDVVQHERSLRHCISPANYWDSVFTLRRGW